VYAALPAEPELSVVRQHASGRAKVLDLGCGTGRIADPLAADGHVVVAVDESPEMLAEVRVAQPVHAQIEDLDLDDRFDLVLGLSYLMNSPDVRSRVLATCSRHVAADGLVLMQRHDPARRLRASDTETRVGDVRLMLADVDDSAWPTVHATTVYRLGDDEWRQAWTTVILDDAATDLALQEAGLEALSLDGSWVTARPRG
jgi:SAM-dependent methyltransferase